VSSGQLHRQDRPLQLLPAQGDQLLLPLRRTDRQISHMELFMVEAMHLSYSSAIRDATSLILQFCSYLRLSCFDSIKWGCEYHYCYEELLVSFHYVH
jgi:hypothetical protein